MITDNSVSASKHGRTGYVELLRRIEEGGVDIVVILRIDRLLRLNDELEQLVAIAERTGVQIATVEGDINLSTPSGRLMARVLVSVARAEIEYKSARHKLANAQKAAAGKPHGSRRPFGYNADQMTLYEPEARVLRRMAAMVLAGESYKTIAYQLNTEGIQTTEGKSFYPITIRNMLLKPRYGGLRVYQGETYQGIWTPMFDAETWRRLQLTMRVRSAARDSERPQARKYLLTGFVVCQCGANMNGSKKRDHPGQPERRTYRCRRDGDTGRYTGCGKVRRNADALDDWVKECVLYRLDSPALSSLLREAGDDAELGQLLDDRQQQQQRLDGLSVDYATGLLDRRQFEIARTAAAGRLREMDRLIEGTQRKALQLDVPLDKTLRVAWDEATDEWRRSVLSLFIKRIVVRGGNKKPFYKGWRFDPSLIDIEWTA